MDPFRAKNAVPADYMPGAQDGSRPGHINVNEWDPEHRLTLNIEAIAYHEGVPGHHLQISIGQELKDLPAFRKNGDYTAFIEGWALYSERLGKEIGFYEDPYSDYGRLENEMWRAIRLVIDTGVHEKRWSRDQMVDFFHRYTAMDEPNVQTEVDRYIAWPGQALAYKLGQLEILRLREEARQKLGSKFDLRAFHDEVVGSGPLPLDVLRTRSKVGSARRPRGRNAFPPGYRGQADRPGGHPQPICPSRDVALELGNASYGGELHSIASRLFGPVQGLIRGLDYILDRANPGPGFSHADADRDRNFGARGCIAGPRGPGCPSGRGSPARLGPAFGASPVLAAKILAANPVQFWLWTA